MIKRLLVVFLAALPAVSVAENVMQFTGGNYVFADNGRLTFNLSPKVFENRRWVYDAESQSAKTVFTLRMPLKTANASVWHGYQVQNNQPWGLHHAAGMGSHHYQYNPQNHRKVAIPLIAGAVAIGGRILLQTVPPIIINCARSANCATGALVTGAHLVGICQINISTGAFKGYLPPGICEQAEADGYQKNDQGEYVRPGGRLKFKSAGSNRYVPYLADYPTYIDPSAYEQTRPIFERVCKKAVADSNAANKRNDRFREIKFVPAGNDLVVYCSIDGFSGNEGFSFFYSIDNTEEKLTMIDLENYIKEDFKANPTQYINDKGDIGQGLRGVITLGQADLRAGDGGSQNGGTLSFYSPPYRNQNGDTVQDRVTIHPPQPYDKPKESGQAKDGASGGQGVSTTINNVKVENISRPDKESESQPGENNNANNGSSGGGSGSSGGNGENGNQETGDHCKNNPDAVGCAKLGDVEEGENPFGIPTVEDGTVWKPDNFLPATGVCPQPKVVQIMGKTHEFSWHWICEFADKIRALIVGLAAIAAGFIVFKRS